MSKLFLVVLSSFLFLACGEDKWESTNVPVQGTQGFAGKSCQVEPALGGVLIQCDCSTDFGVVTCASSGYVKNGIDGSAGPQGDPGLNGQDGQDGATGPEGSPAPVNPYTILKIIDPCGDAPGIYDEVILRLGTGQLLSAFSDNVDGYNTRFSLLVPGSYQTTDGSNCHFSVGGDGVVTDQNGGVFNP